MGKVPSNGASVDIADLLLDIMSGDSDLHVMGKVSSDGASLDIGWVRSQDSNSKQATATQLHCDS